MRLTHRQLHGLYTPSIQVASIPPHRHRIASVQLHQFSPSSSARPELSFTLVQTPASPSSPLVSVGKLYQARKSEMAMEQLEVPSRVS